jgi:anti-sigma factor RsiW
MSPLEEPIELEWSAFRYIADELSPAEAAEFEQRLASDQNAREAVASAVQMAEAVAALQPAPLALAPTVTGQRPRRAAWAALVVAASCAVLLVGTFILGRVSSSGSPDAAALQANEGADQLLNLWAVSHDGLDVWADADEGDAPIEAGSDEEFAVPTWMLAAAEIDATGQWDSAPDAETAPVEQLQHN